MKKICIKLTEYDGCRIYLSEDINTESKDSATMLSIYKSKSYKKASKHAVLEIEKLRDSHEANEQQLR